MYELKLESKNGITYIRPSGLIEKSIFVAFTTRIGGFSNAPYDSLNLAFHVEDEPRNINKNRKLIAGKMDFNVKKLTCAQQVHGTTIKTISEKSIGAGHFVHDDALEGTDGIMTDTKGAPIAMFFADCLPVVLVSLKPKLVAVVHAGHKGLFEGIVSKLVERMDRYCKPENLLAFLGPSIGPCCYNVSRERIIKFNKRFSDIVNIDDESLDLKKIAAHQFISRGVPSASIFRSSFCTYCNSDLFFSFRREKTTGRQAAIAHILQ